MSARLNRYLKPAAVLLIGTAAAYWLLVGKPTPEPLAHAEPAAPAVQVVAAQPADMALSVTTQGTVTPRKEINIISQVAGLVQEVDEHFAVGGFFDAGTVLVKVEDSDYRFARVRAQARVADAAQLVALEKGRVRQAKREWRDLGDEEANQLFLRKPQLASAEATLHAAQADLGQAELDLGRTAITVPFAGRISEKHVDVGQYVTPGTPIARVYATDVVEIRLPLTDRQVALLDLPLSYQDMDEAQRRRAPVRLSARFADRLWQWQGEIVRTDASIDVDSRVVYAVVEVYQPFARDPDTERPPLSIGLFVDAEIRGRRLPGVTALPRSALRNDGSVLLVNREDRLEQREVRVLQSNLREAWVQGLERGDRVVVSDLPMAIAGMSVTVQEPPSLALGVE